MKDAIPIIRADLAVLKDADQNASIAAQLLFRAQYGERPRGNVEQRPISIGVASLALAEEIARQHVKPLSAGHAVAFLGRELSRARIELRAMREQLEALQINAKPHAVKN